MNTIKKLFALVMGVSVLAPAQGQLFTPEGLSGAAWGGLMGGIIGHNSCGNDTGEGIAIGAGAGFLLGTLAHHSRAERAYYSSYEPASGQTEYYDPNGHYTAPAHSETYPPSRAFAGAVIGGIAGGIIGDNNHHQALEGAAIGIGAGLLLGGLADYFAYRRERARHAYTDYCLRSAPPVETTPPAAPPPQTSTVTAARPATPMSGVNALFGR